MPKESLYDIPPGCICLGDGLMGMKCTAIRHATLRPANPPAPTVPTDEELDDCIWIIVEAIQLHDIPKAKRIIRQVRDRTREATLFQVQTALESDYDITHFLNWIREQRDIRNAKP